MRKIILILLLIPLIMGSCVTNKKTTYLQGEGAFPDTAITAQPVIYRVQVNDNLYIRVITPDPQWSAMFNTIPQTGYFTAGSEQSVDLISYNVQSSGNIDMPYIGFVQVAGMTLSEVKQVVEDAIKNYLTDAAVTVKLVNNYVSLLGDVKRPGRYPIYKEQMNIFQALAMGGDLDDYSDRYNVQIVRQKPEGTVVEEFDLTKRDILTSEFFYIMPNDVIYAKPMKGKFFKMNAFPYAVILSTITTFVLVLNFVK
jgi:polysaccharide export outer membrane protein